MSDIYDNLILISTFDNLEIVIPLIGVVTVALVIYCFGFTKAPEPPIEEIVATLHEKKISARKKGSSVNVVSPQHKKKQPKSNTGSSSANANNSSNPSLAHQRQQKVIELASADRQLEELRRRLAESEPSKLNSEEAEIDSEDSHEALGWTVVQVDKRSRRKHRRDKSDVSSSTNQSENGQPKQESVGYSTDDQMLAEADDDCPQCAEEKPNSNSKPPRKSEASESSDCSPVADSRSANMNPTGHPGDTCETMATQSDEQGRYGRSADDDYEDDFHDSLSDLSSDGANANTKPVIRLEDDGEPDPATPTANQISFNDSPANQRLLPAILLDGVEEPNTPTANQLTFDDSNAVCETEISSEAFDRAEGIPGTNENVEGIPATNENSEGIPETNENSEGISETNDDSEYERQSSATSSALSSSRSWADMIDEVEREKSEEEGEFMGQLDDDCALDARDDGGDDTGGSQQNGQLSPSSPADRYPHKTDDTHLRRSPQRSGDRGHHQHPPPPHHPYTNSAAHPDASRLNRSNFRLRHDYYHQDSSPPVANSYPSSAGATGGWESSEQSYYHPVPRSAGQTMPFSSPAPAASQDFDGWQEVSYISRRRRPMRPNGRRPPTFVPTNTY